jgi:hypothetical protein
MRGRKLSVLVIVIWASGCTGQVGDPDRTVKTFHLSAGALEALWFSECLSLHGRQGCTPQPNPLGCTTMQVLGDERVQRGQLGPVALVGRPCLYAERRHGRTGGALEPKRRLSSPPVMARWLSAHTSER